MSDYDDYENNLFFPPVRDMSKLNDCNEGKRGSNVLLSTVDKCKDLEEKLANSEKMRDLQAEYACKLEEKLRIAEEGVEKIKTASSFGRIKGINVSTPDGMRLKSIEVLAEELLGKIKE